MLIVLQVIDYSACNHVDCWNCYALNARIPVGCGSEMAGTDAEAVVDFLVGSNEHLWRPSTWQTPEETTFGTDYSDLLGEQLQKSTADV